MCSGAAGVISVNLARLRGARELRSSARHSGTEGMGDARTAVVWAAKKFDTAVGCPRKGEKKNPPQKMDRLICATETLRSWIWKDRGLEKKKWIPSGEQEGGN